MGTLPRLFGGKCEAALTFLLLLLPHVGQAGGDCLLIHLLVAHLIIGKAFDERFDDCRDMLKFILVRPA